MRRRSLAVGVLLAAGAVAGCGGSGSSAAAPPTATALAARIPHCGSPVVNTPAVIELQDVTCSMPDNSQVTIATFADSSDEKTWISDGGSPMTPDPAYIGCCIQGSEWAATISNVDTGTIVDFWKVMHAIGGREVSG